MRHKTVNDFLIDLDGAEIKDILLSGWFPGRVFVELTVFINSSSVRFVYEDKNKERHYYPTMKKAVTVYVTGKP